MKNKTIVFFSFKAVLIVCLMLFSFGCATSKAIIPMDKAYSQQLMQYPIAVIVLVPNKNLFFWEGLYKVFAIQTISNEFTFEGIWDPTPVFKDMSIQMLRTKFNLKAFPLQEKLAPDTYNKLIADLGSSFSEAASESVTTTKRRFGADPQILWIARTGLGGGRNGASGQEMVEYIKTSPLKHIHSQKESLTGHAVLEFYITGIGIQGPPYTLLLVVYTRLSRPTDGAVIWANMGIGASRLEDLKGFPELEKNNLALLKEHYEKALVGLLNPENPNNLFKDFLSK
ncbi:MAG: hypothetical protein FD156_1581 [Nitrospirae bacterium]|nr:MAG: hypothetical protein FD156_1581 [Nitrospirota bacterium]